jgi:two-component system, OmpR family, response regulator RegX3
VPSSSDERERDAEGEADADGLALALARRWIVRRTVSVRTCGAGSVSAVGAGALGVLLPPEASATVARMPRAAIVAMAAIEFREKRMTGESSPTPKGLGNLGLSLGKARAGAATFGRVQPPLKPRVLFVEDESSIYEPFSKALAREGFEPIVASTAARALELAEDGDFAIVLLDLMLPDGDGRDVARAIRRNSSVPILMLTARGTEADRIVGLELGADDYVVKPFSGAEVIARIRAILRRSATTPAGEEEPPPGPVTVGELEVDFGSRRAHLAKQELTLSRKEFDLLAELIRHAGRVVTREQLMDRVWDENWFGSTKTLDVHIRWLRRKLGDDPADPRYVHTVRGVGFRFTAPEEFS